MGCLKTVFRLTCGSVWRRQEGSELADAFRDALTKEMPPAQITEAQKLARE